MTNKTCETCNLNVDPDYPCWEEFPVCDESNDYQEQNANEMGDGWYFPPCESKSPKEVGFGTRWAKHFKCPDCKKVFEVESVNW